MNFKVTFYLKHVMNDDTLLNDDIFLLYFMPIYEFEAYNILQKTNSEWLSKVNAN